MTDPIADLRRDLMAAAERDVSHPHRLPRIDIRPVLALAATAAACAAVIVGIATVFADGGDPERAVTPNSAAAPVLADCGDSNGSPSVRPPRARRHERPSTRPPRARRDERPSVRPPRARRHKRPSGRPSRARRHECPSPLPPRARAASALRDCGDTEERRPSLTSAPPAQEILDAFAVFTRAGDEGAPPAQDWKSLVSGPTYSGVHANYGQLLAERDGTRYYGAAVAEIPGRPVGRGDDCLESPDGGTGGKPGVCLVIVAAKSSGGACHPLARAISGNFIWPEFSLPGDEPLGETTWFGFAPNGVTAVIFEPEGADERVVAPVRGNFFVVSIPSSEDEVRRGRVVFREADGTEREVGPNRFPPTP